MTITGLGRSSDNETVQGQWSEPEATEWEPEKKGAGTWLAVWEVGEKSQQNQSNTQVPG